MTQEDNKDHNKRIAKNTLALYARMLFSMAISLYTTRVVLNTLGVVDFGLYNVVGGVVTMLSFLNSAMSLGTQRFLNYEMGQQNNKAKLARIFSMSLSIHMLIAIIVLILAESLGLWFLNTQMTIPADRINTANLVYQCSVLSAILTLTQVPYSASIIAHERMRIYALIGVSEVLLRLVVVFLLMWFMVDKLKLYAIFMLCSTFSITIVYRIYCKRNFKECSYSFFIDGELFKTMASFAGWNIFASLSQVANQQGQNILLNIFAGPAVNAARGIAFQLNNALSSFVVNFQTAVNPQIIKSHAAKEYNYRDSLMFRSSKISFFLLLLLDIPILLETRFLMNLWLNDIPDYAVIFCRLMIISSLINSFTISLDTVALATGKIKMYRLCIGLLLLLNIPISYLFLKLGYSPVSVFIVYLAIIILTFTARLILLKKIIRFNVTQYFKNVLLRSMLILTLSLTVSLLIRSMFPDGIIRMIIVTVLTTVLSSVFIFLIGLTKGERNLVIKGVVKIKQRFNIG